MSVIPRRSGPWTRTPSAPPPTVVLPEVQALRALAVGLVVAYHAWPRALPGGYVGVDVFFVISGFLITGHLVRSLERGTFSFRSFYLRRARRLLPAALVVLLATGVAVLLLLPYARWREPLTELVASALYVQNWVLAIGGSEYSAGTGTAAQHYWSLSVEEQFYLVWPLVLLALWRLSRRAGWAARHTVVVGLAVLTAASFAASVALTPADESVAYFGTHTRVWEFGVGGLLSQLRRRPVASAHRAAASWAGVVAVLASAVLMGERTPFPGSAALVPVLGAATVVLAGLPDARWGPGAPARSRPVQLVGDWSYSIYLWHWPLLVLAPQVVGDEPGPWGRAGLVGLCVVLAVLTKAGVEDRFREGPAAPGPAPLGGARRDGVLAGLLVAAVGVAGAGLVLVHARAAVATDLERAATARGLGCFGAAALASPGCEPPFGDRLVPDPASALAAFQGTWAHEECFADVTATDLLECGVGDPGAGTHVALVGDSHALQWSPALERVAADRGWRVTTLLRASCPVNLAVTHHVDPAERDRCDAWSRAVVDRVAEDASVDLVLTTAKTNKRWEGPDGGLSRQAGVDGYARAWERMTAAGARVLVVSDTPRSDDGVLDCLTTTGGASCDVPRSEAMGGDDDVTTTGDGSLERAVALADDPLVRLWDPTDLICTASTCPAVVGGVVVFADESHLTPAYVRTLAPSLGEQVVLALEDDGTRAAQLDGPPR